MLCDAMRLIVWLAELPQALRKMHMLSKRTFLCPVCMCLTTKRGEGIKSARRYERGGAR